MLTLHDGDCRLDRRQLLTLGGLTLGGLSLSSLIAARAAGSPSNPLVTGKSVIFIFQQGGPSQFETFDPKIDAPAEIRTVTDVVRTSIPGVLFGASMRQLSGMAHKLTIVRSFQTDNAGHNIVPIVCPETLNANLGALYSRVAGAMHPATGMPANAVLFPQAVCADVVRGQGRGDLAATGFVGANHAPFIPGGPNQLLSDLRLNLPSDRFQHRRALLAQFDRVHRRFGDDPQMHNLDQAQRQACETLLHGRVAQALDLSRENSRLVARYDTSRFAVADGWSSAARGRRGYYTGHAKSLGKSLLLARRLCEAGCGFVTVHCGYEGVWDMHADEENLNMVDGMAAVGGAFDHGLAALIGDLEARGLDEKILVVACGEMGRTPRLNRTGGRDHWAKLAPLLLYGGGMPAGRVIGQSTRDGGEPVGDNLTIRNLISTILHTVLDIGQLRLQPAFAPLTRLAEANPIAFA